MGAKRGGYRPQASWAGTRGQEDQGLPCFGITLKGKPAQCSQGWPGCPSLTGHCSFHRGPGGNGDRVLVAENVPPEQLLGSSEAP